MRTKNGFILISTMLMLTLLLGLLGIYFSLTSIETSTVRQSKSSASGFYTAEAGLNLRADQIRQIFVGSD